MFPPHDPRPLGGQGGTGEAMQDMFSDRSRAGRGALTGALALVVAFVLAGCGGDDGAKAPSATQATTGAAKATKQTGTSDRGARRCSKSALLAALLADVDRVPFTVDEVRCKGKFARSRFEWESCPAGQTSAACGTAKVAAWRLGAKRWKLISYGDGLSCAEVRKKAADYPSALCG